MHKQEFLEILGTQLSVLPAEDRNERLCFYSELIDDRIEDGLSEEDATLAVGNPRVIAAQILFDMRMEAGQSDSRGASASTDGRKPRLGAWGMILLVLGAPVWFSLLVAAVSVAVSLYAALWSVVASLWAVFGSFAVAAPVSVLCGIGISVFESPLTGLALGGAALVLAGLTVFLYFGCLAATKGTVQLTKLLFRLTKRAFQIGGEHRA